MGSGVVLAFDRCFFSAYQFHGVGGAHVSTNTAADTSIEIAHRQLTIHFQGLHPAPVDAGAAATTGIVVYGDNPVGDNGITGYWVALGAS